MPFTLQPLLEYRLMHQSLLVFSISLHLQPHHTPFLSNLARRPSPKTYCSHIPLHSLFITLTIHTSTSVPFQLLQICNLQRTLMFPTFITAVTLHYKQILGIHCKFLSKQQTSSNFKFGLSNLSCSTEFLVFFFSLLLPFLSLSIMK